MSEWTVYRLGDLVHIKHGYAFKGEYISDVAPGSVLVTPGNFAIGGGFKAGKEKYYKGPEVADFSLSPGDLVVTMTDLSKAGDTLGYSAIIPSGCTYLHNQRIGLVEIKKKDLVDKSYLHYALRVDRYRRHVLSGATGSTVRHTSPSRIADYEIVLPPLREQRYIAEVLRAIDDKIVINDRIFGICHSLGDELLRADIPRMSTTATVGEMARAGDVDFGDGYRTKRSEYGWPGLPILRVAEVLDGRIAAKREDCVSETYRRAMGSKTSKAGDVIVTTKGTVGRVAIIPDKAPEFVYSPQVCYFRPRAESSLTPSYLFFWFRSASFWMQARSLKSQTDMADYLNLSDIRSLAIEIPDSDSRQLLEKLSLLQAEASQKLRESESLAEMRDMLLPKLMSGEIRVRDVEKLAEEET